MRLLIAISLAVLLAVWPGIGGPLAFAEEVNGGINLALLKQAQAGDKEAQMKSGTLYAMGKSVGKDLNKADVWFRRYAGGDGKLNHNVGKIYSRIVKDSGRARIWFERAVKFNYAAAHVGLGKLYLSGDGVEQNFAKANMHLQNALAAGEIGAHGLIGSMYFNGNGRPRDYAVARKHFLLHVAPYDYARELAHIYRQGLGTRRDPVEALKWYRIALINGWNGAMYELGTMYWNGEIAQLDPRIRSLAWFLLGAGHGGEKSARMVERLKSELPRQVAERAVTQAKTLSGKINWYSELADYLNEAPAGFQN
jgi:hypothetical protein